MGISRRSTMVDRWMPLYPEAYLRDTAHLSAEEHGAYLLLLMQAWLNDGVLPTEDSALRRIARMDEKPWKKSRKTIMSFFVLTVEGFHNIRIDFELNKAKEIVAKKVTAGRASGEARRAGKDRREMMQTVDTFVEHEIVSGGDEDEHLFNTCSTPVPVLLTKNTEKHEHNTNPYTYIHGAPVGPPILQPESQQTGAVKLLVEKKPSTACKTLRFDEFWKAYPKKAAKADCMKVWASKKLDAIADQILDDLAIRTANHKPWLDGFVLNPATYLRGERWTDAIEPIAGNSLNPMGLSKAGASTLQAGREWLRQQQAKRDGEQND